MWKVNSFIIVSKWHNKIVLSVIIGWKNLVNGTSITKKLKYVVYFQTLIFLVIGRRITAYIALWLPWWLVDSDSCALLSFIALCIYVIMAVVNFPYLSIKQQLQISERTKLFYSTLVIFLSASHILPG